MEGQHPSFQEITEEDGTGLDRSRNPGGSELGDLGGGESDES